MSYCTQSDLEAAIDLQTLVDLTDDEASGSVNATRLARAIDDADAMINGYLRGRYAVPLATTPAFIRRLSVDLAIHGLYSRKGQAFGQLPDAVRDRYRTATEALRAIRDGQLDLGVEPPPAQSPAIVAEEDGPDRLFTDETLEGF